MKRYGIVVSYALLVSLGATCYGASNAATVRVLKHDSCEIYEESMVDMYYSTGKINLVRPYIKGYFKECVDPLYYDLEIPIQQAVEKVRGLS